MFTAHSRLAIVITDFNGFAQTRRCLAALQAGHFRDFSVTVVDHGTTAETERGLREEFPWAFRLPEASGKWWTGAINAGIRHALARGAEAVMLLNNDCYVTPNTLGELALLCHEHPMAIIAPVQRDWRTGAITSIQPGSLFLLGFPTLPGPRRLTASMKARRVLPTRLIVGGRGVIIPAATFAQVGLFDEMTLPHYGADHDFYLRARSRDISLLVASRALVDIDNDRTSIASDMEGMTWRAFLESLRSPRSHRNLTDVATLFRKHYPVPGLHGLGIFLYIARYFGVFLFRRTVAAIRQR